MEPRRPVARILCGLVILLALIGVVATAARAAVLLYRPDFWDAFLARHPEWGIGDFDDARFSRHAAITFVHIVFAFVFCVLGPLQFVRRIRSRTPALHRWSGRIFVLSAAALGVSGLLLGLTTGLEFGGVSEAAPILVFAPVFLFSLGKAVVHVLRRDFARHREWMIRVFAIGLAAGTDRIVGWPFLLSPAVRQAPQEFIGMTFWIAFTLNLAVAEAWIRYTRPTGEEKRDTRDALPAEQVEYGGPLGGGRPRARGANIHGPASRPG